MGFDMRAGDAVAISTVVHALRDVTSVLRLHFSEIGLAIEQPVSNTEIFISFTIHQEKCITYQCNKSGTISLSPNDLYQRLSGAAQGDEIRLQFKEKYQYLIITIIKEKKDQISEYELQVLNDTEEFSSLEAVSKCFDFVLAIDAQLLHNTFSNLVNLGSSKVLRLSCNKDRLELYCTFDDVTSFARFRFSFGAERARKTIIEDVTDTCNRKAVKTKDKVDLLLSTAHIGQLLKTFNVTKHTIVMYISEEFPVVFELKIGLLGTLKVTVLPVFEN